MQTDFLQYIFQAINNLLTQNLGFFDTMGQNLFRSFATILVAWFGIKSALASASGRPSFQFDHFASLLLTISFGFAMVNYYSTPIPGFGDILGTAIYIIVTLLLAAAQAIAIVVIAYGFIATAVCVLVGPVFVPFFIVPKMEWLFWGWFRCFIQYAFYQVVAAAVVYVIGNLMLGALRLPPAGTLSTVQLIAWFPVLFITFLASIYVLLKIPSLTNHIFSGTAGGSSAGLLEAPAAVLNRVM